MCLIQGELRLLIDLWFLRRRSDRLGEVQQQGIEHVRVTAAIYHCGQIYTLQGVQSEAVWSLSKAEEAPNGKGGHKSMERNARADRPIFAQRESYSEVKRRTRGMRGIPDFVF